MNYCLELVIYIAQPAKTAEKSNYFIYHEEKNQHRWTLEVFISKKKKFLFHLQCQCKVILYLFTHKNWAFHFVRSHLYVLELPEDKFLEVEASYRAWWPCTFCTHGGKAQGSPMPLTDELVLELIFSFPVCLWIFTAVSCALSLMNIGNFWWVNPALLTNPSKAYPCRIETSFQFSSCRD